MKHMSKRVLRFVDGQGFDRVFYSLDQKRLERRSRRGVWWRWRVSWVLAAPGVWFAYGPFGEVARVYFRPATLQWREGWIAYLRKPDGKVDNPVDAGTMAEVHAALRDAWKLEPRESFEPVGEIHG
jgi:hypothetical protein